MRAGMTRDENRRDLAARIRVLEVEYERRVLGPDDFPDAEMRAMRSRARELRAAYDRLRFPTTDNTEE